ncbi:MAG TPA: hypothetical protein VKE70_20135 [Candidatus Solibacter sp.]|nr:hypothetical protein [Candidatus Solibacter sp.]
MAGCIPQRLRSWTPRCAWLILAASLSSLRAGEGPYFVTYSHYMEEPGNLEVGFINSLGRPDQGNRFFNNLAELEYGVKTWWTSELYLHGQSTRHDSTVFTGFRFENRFRLLRTEHWINPVLYVEYENINGADRSLKEIVGSDGQDDLRTPNDEARRERKHEVEAKLILGSSFKGWTIAENFIAEKNLGHEPFEFGYAVAVGRPLALAARPDPCRFCRENFSVGLEAYGGLGTHEHFTPRGASHYLAPTVAWALPGGTTFRVSPGFGLTGSSLPFLLRFGVSYEISQFGQKIERMFR